MRDLADKKRQVWMSDSLWDEIHQVAKDSGLEDGRGINSELIRQVMSAVTARWFRSPYIVRSSKHLIFIAADSTVFYRLTEVLRLNSDRRLLPFKLEMRPEKKKYFRSLQGYKDEGEEFIRRKWLLNFFGVRHAGAATGPAIATFTDRDGVTSKEADLLVEALPNRLLERELVAGIADYSLAAAPSLDPYDRAGTLVGVPTQQLELTVAVDEALYAATLPSGDEISDLTVEYRNADGAKFTDRDIDPRNPARQFRGRGGPELGTRIDVGAQAVQAELESFRQRWLELVAAEADNGPLVPDEENPNGPRLRERVGNAFCLPARFRFLHLTWPSPQHGVEVCVHWERPRGEGP